MKKNSIFAIGLMLVSLNAAATPETNTATYLTSHLNNPKKLTEFLYRMPKGGDLHNHASGSTFAENMVKYALADNLCVDRMTFKVSNDKCQPENLLANAVKDPVFYDALVDAWSMQHFKAGSESGHDHFFNTFDKFGAISHQHLGEILAEITERAGKQNELYVETMVTADNNASGLLGKKLGFNENFAQMRYQLLQNGFDKIIADMSANLDAVEKKQREVLRCGTKNAKAGCKVTLRYQYQVLRELAPEMVFAQLLAGFEGASKDKRIVGLNMVMPEDGKVSMGDYKLHMQMVAFLHAYYPNVHITLHAGELTNALVPEEGLKFHINDAVHTAFAERIGHGVDIIHENNYTNLLQYMSQNRVMVEINLSSNEGILNVSGKDHPLSLYMQYGVPVALSTDDEGVSRDILTTEYVKAVTTYQLDYPTLKNMVRNSIAYSFLPGENLWKDTQYREINPACKQTAASSKSIGQSCQAFLNNNEKAAMQWELEKRFAKFEKQF